jgi:hypothetical protein
MPALLAIAEGMLIGATILGGVFILAVLPEFVAHRKNVACSAFGSTELQLDFRRLWLGRLSWLRRLQ